MLKKSNRLYKDMKSKKLKCIMSLNKQEAKVNNRLIDYLQLCNKKKTIVEKN